MAKVYNGVLSLYDFLNSECVLYDDYDLRYFRYYIYPSKGLLLEIIEREKKKKYSSQMRKKEAVLTAYNEVMALQQQSYNEILNYLLKNEEGCYDCIAYNEFYGIPVIEIKDFKNDLWGFFEQKTNLYIIHVDLYESDFRRFLVTDNPMGAPTFLYYSEWSVLKVTEFFELSKGWLDCIENKKKNLPSDLNSDLETREKILKNIAVHPSKKYMIDWIIENSLTPDSKYEKMSYQKLFYDYFGDFRIWGRRNEIEQYEIKVPVKTDDNNNDNNKDYNFFPVVNFTDILPLAIWQIEDKSTLEPYYFMKLHLSYRKGLIVTATEPSDSLKIDFVLRDPKEERRKYNNLNWEILKKPKGAESKETESKETDSKPIYGLAIASLGLGILTAILSLIGFGKLFGVGAILLGFLAISMGKCKKIWKVMSIIGIVLGIAAIVFIMVKGFFYSAAY